MVASQALQFANTYIDAPFLQGKMATLVQRLKSTKGGWTIGAAIALVYAARALYTMCLPPKQLRHLPRVGLFPVLYRSLLMKNTNFDLFKSLYQPVVMKHKIHVRFDRGNWTVMITDPVLANQILVKSGENVPKVSFMNEKGTLPDTFFGVNSILFENGDQWRKHRFLANPAFKRAHPIELFGHATNTMFKMLDEKYEQSFELQVVDLMNRWTLDIISRVGYGFDMRAVADENNHYKMGYEMAMEDVFNPLYMAFQFLDKKLLWMLPQRQKSFQNVRNFLETITNLIDERRQDVKNHKYDDVKDTEKDLLTHMLEAEVRGEGTLTTSELLNDIVIFFVAGHETTATSLSAAFYFLAKHPEAQKKARDEAIKILHPNGETNTDVNPSAAQIKDLVYVNQVIKESLRRHPPASALVSGRKIQTEMILDGYLLQKGTEVNVGILELHHNPNIWDDKYPVHEFHPERFAPGSPDENNPAWLPFSSGTRQCIGLNLAMTEMRVLLALMLLKYEWTIDPSSEHYDQLRHINIQLMRPKDLFLQFTRRY
ncbi:cytochrome P450 [Gongronella butleri]|nr:cytochrome P450 [Gongronella butleri]